MSQRTLTFQLIVTILVLIIKVAIFIGIVYFIFTLIINPGAIGEWFGELVGSFNQAKQ